MREIKVINIFTVLYDLTWTVILIFSLPLLPFVKHSRLLKRLYPNLSHIHSGHKHIWIHALSVGEVISTLPVIRSLKQTFPSKHIVFTITTEQGMEIARKQIEKDMALVLPMPLDFWWSIKRMIEVINPSLFILVETDIWPGLISRLHKRGIHAFLINGRISPRTFRLYKRFRVFTKVTLNAIDLCLMQSDLDRDRLRSIGLPPKKVQTVGNIKFDRDWQPMDDLEHSQWRHNLNISIESRVWIAGSTHEQEENILLDTFKRLIPHFPKLRLIIAPRRIERASHIRELCEQKGLLSQYRTDLNNEGKHHYEVLILDTIGELDRIYGLAEISFVGGSLVPIGGHNLLEPASFGCPVLFGPYIHNFIRMSELLIDTGGGIMVKDTETLFATVKELLSSPEKLKELGTKAKEFAEKNRGALTRIMDHIRGYMEND